MNQEIERQKRIMNMLITAHSVLRDKYSNLSSSFDYFLIVASCVLNTLIFVDDQYILKTFHISTDNQQLIIGGSSIIVFTISIVLLKVEWKEKLANHSKAAIQLFELLQECRQISTIIDEENRSTAAEEFSVKYRQVNSTLIKIPERDFNSLKLKHLRKIEISKMIDANPRSFLWVIKLKLFLSSF